MIGVGTAQGAGGTAAPDMHAYHLAFFAAALLRYRRRAVLALHPRQRRRGDDRAPPPPALRVVHANACRGPSRECRVTPPGSVGVFCGSSVGVNPSFAAAAGRLGAALARRGITLVYGGASVGLMGVLADAVVAAGGKATGVITESLAGHEIAHAALDDLHVVTTMHERKALMSELSDAFIMLPGGFGTYEEFMESVTWVQLGIHDKRCGILNVDGFFDHLLTFLSHAVAMGFIRYAQVELLAISDDVDGLLEALSMAPVPSRSD